VRAVTAAAVLLAVLAAASAVETLADTAAASAVGLEAMGVLALEAASVAEPVVLEVDTVGKNYQLAALRSAENYAELLQTRVIIQYMPYNSTASSLKIL
jgi:hypothetical protein